MVRSKVAIAVVVVLIVLAACAHKSVIRAVMEETRACKCE